jgi:hypothetical protein
MKAFFKKPWGKALILLALFLVFLAAFMEIRARGELKLAQSYAADRNHEKAILHYFQALNWYSPWGASQTAASELYLLGLSLKEKDESRLAYLAFLRLRAGLNAARSFYFPRKELIDTANRELAHYLAREKIKENPPPQTLTEDYGREQAEFFYKLYANTPETYEAGLFLAVFGFFLWTIGCAKAIISLFREDNVSLEIKFHRARYSVSAFILGYIFWLLGMAYA